MIALNCAGFAEAIGAISVGAASFSGSTANDIRVISVITCVGLMILAAIGGVRWYAKVGFALFAVLCVAIGAICFGSLQPRTAAMRAAGFVGYDAGASGADAGRYTSDAVTGSPTDFVVVFSIFFPSATGIMGGANLSGDLAKPSVSIPRGTFMGIAFTAASHIALVVVYGLSCAPCVGEYCSAAMGGAVHWASAGVNATLPRGGLLFNYFLPVTMSLWGPLTYAGIIAAAVSSALGGMICGPLVLQAISRDGLFDSRFVRAFAGDTVEGGGAGDPLLGTIVTCAVALAFIMIGDLNSIASIVTSGHLVTFAVINYACFLSATSKSIGWRPTFKYFNAFVALFGVLLNLAVAFAIEWASSIAVCGVAGGAYVVASRVRTRVDWGSTQQAVAYEVRRAQHSPFGCVRGVRPGVVRRVRGLGIV